jgi:hypothetical protein
MFVCVEAISLQKAKLRNWNIDIDSEFAKIPGVVLNEEEVKMRDSVDSNDLILNCRDGNPFLSFSSLSYHLMD